MTYCRRCGAQLEENAGFCHKCGTQVIAVLPSLPVAPSKPPRTPISSSTIILIVAVTVAVLVVAGIFVILTFTPIGSTHIIHSNQTNVGNFDFPWQNKAVTHGLSGWAPVGVESA